MAGLTGRVLGAFAIHLVLLGLVAGLILMFTDEFADASELIRSKFDQTENPEQAVQIYLDGAKAQLIKWTAYSLVFSLLATMVFLFIAHRAMPGTENEARQKTPLWFVLFVLTLIVASAVWWSSVSALDVGASLIFSNYATILSVGWIAILLAYFLGTALFVKNTMKPAVPLAVVLKGF